LITDAPAFPPLPAFRQTGRYTRLEGHLSHLLPPVKDMVVNLDVGRYKPA
jgi:hypothetical protein